MSIADIRGFIKGFLASRQKDLFVGVLILLVALGSFALGRLSVQEGASSAFQASPVPQMAATAQAGMVVGSKNSFTYYFPWCGVARNIKDANKVWFTSASVAKEAGYRVATNCKGLE